MTKLVETQHHDPDRAEASLQHGRRQPDGRHGPRLPGRARDGRRQPAARPVQPGRHSARAARRAADRSQVRHRRQRHSSTCSAKDLGTGKEQTVEIEQSSGLSEGRDRADAEGRRGARRRRQEEARTGRSPQPGRVDVLPARKADQGAQATSSRTADKAAARSRDRQGPRSGQGRRTSTPSRPPSASWSRPRTP